MRKQSNYVSWMLLLLLLVVGCCRFYYYTPPEHSILIQANMHAYIRLVLPICIKRDRYEYNDTPKMNFSVF